MENMNRAIIMGGQVLIFIVALSAAVFLYQTLINTQDTILIASDSYSREAEHLSSNEDYTRIVKGSEIYGTLLSAIESTDMSAVIHKDDYNVDYIKVGLNDQHPIDIKTFKEQYKNNNEEYMTGNTISQADIFKYLRNKNINYNDNYKLTYVFNKVNNTDTVTAVFTRVFDE